MRDSSIMLTVVVLVLLLVIIVFGFCRRQQDGQLIEPFATQRDKATAIYEWFRDHPVPKYTDYQRDLDRASNIVEYEDVLAISRERLLTRADVESVIRR